MTPPASLVMAPGAKSTSNQSRHAAMAPAVGGPDSPFGGVSRPLSGSATVGIDALDAITA
jgi:hypothetical protein